MDWISQFLSETSGKASNIRLLASIMVVVACGLLVYATVTKGTVDNSILGAAAMLLTVAFTGKVAQKVEEKKP